MNKLKSFRFAEPEHSPGASGADSLGFESGLSRHRALPSWKNPCLAGAMAFDPEPRGRLSRRLLAGRFRHLPARPISRTAFLKHRGFALGTRRAGRENWPLDIAIVRIVKVVRHDSF